MVVCQYFLRGECRFGDKCRYEHPSAKKKTVCPHFLNGYCRFGDKCWNDHPRGRSGFSQQQQSGFGEGFRQSSSSRSGQWSRSYHNNQNRFEALSTGPRDTFGVQPSKAADGEQTISQIKKTIENDIEIWGTSKQWPLSCYTYTKEEPCLQGLLDFSAEEIRFEAYKANAEGKADSYQQGLKDLINANQLRRHQLGQMSVSQIQEEIKKQTAPQGSEAMDAGASIQQAGSGFFGNSAPFGQSGESFSSNSSLIQSSVFPTVTSTSSQSGLFGPGNVTNQSGLFGQNSVSTGLTGSVFSNSASSTNQTMTGISSSFPATNQSGALFGTKPDQSAASNGLFSAKPELKPGLFGSSSPTTSSGLFSSGPQLQKDSATISASPIAPTSSIKSTSETSSSKEQTPSVAPVSLTCSDEDMQAFMADSFVLGKIPECPPPLELC